MRRVSTPSERILELAGAPPSVEAWRELCAILDAPADAPAEEIAIDIEAIDAALADWPDALRRAPSGWMCRLAEGDAVPALLLARVAELAYPTLEDIERAGRSPYLRRLRCLEIVMGDVQGEALVRALDDAPGFAGLRALALRLVHLGAEGGEALGRAGLLARIERLELTSTEIDAQAIAHWPNAAALRELRVSPVPDDSLASLARAPNLTAEARAPFKDEARVRAARLALQRPSDETFRERLCPLLSCFEERDFRAGALDELMEALSRWPKDARPAPATWLGWLLDGEDAAPLRFVGAVHAYALRGTGRVAEDVALLARLFAMPALAHVTTLDLRYCIFDEQGLLMLCASPLLGRVRTLGLGQPLTPRVVDALAGAAHAQGLCSLSLVGCVPSAEALRALLSSPLLARLTDLDLACNALGDEGARALAGALSNVLAGLRRLGLRDNAIGDAGVAAIARSPHLAGLVELDADSNPLGDRAARAIATSPHLRRLTTLKLGYGGKIGDPGALALARSEGLGTLQHLGLDFNAIGDRGAAALVGSTRLRSLRRLEICYGNRITTAGAMAMARAAVRAPLLEIDLGPGSRISKKGSEALRATSLVPRDDAAGQG